MGLEKLTQPLLTSHRAVHVIGMFQDVDSPVPIKDFHGGSGKIHAKPPVPQDLPINKHVSARGTHEAIKRGFKSMFAQSTARPTRAQEHAVPIVLSRPYRLYVFGRNLAIICIRAIEIQEDELRGSSGW